MTEAVKAIVTDIEGTTSSLSFVKDVLFPYARQHIAAFVSAHQQDDDVAGLLDAIRKHIGENATLEQLIDQLHEWIDTDQKVTELKALQGLLWKNGYESGDFRGHVYSDAYESLVQWHTAGVRLYVYSSGSVFAQKLLFGYSDFGDMTPLFSGYFDTNIGHKQQTSSYQAIVSELGISAADILFLSDIGAELDAARDAGMQTCQLLRDEQAVPAPAHTQVTRFTDIRLPL